MPFQLFIFCKPLCLQRNFNERLLSIWVFSVDGHYGLIAGRKRAGRWNGLSALGPKCDAEKDWHERFFRASGEINDCQKFPPNEPETNFSSLIFEPPVAYLPKPFWFYRPKIQYVYVCCNDA